MISIERERKKGGGVEGRAPQGRGRVRPREAISTDTHRADLQPDPFSEGGASWPDSDCQVHQIESNRLDFQQARLPDH